MKQFSYRHAKEAELMDSLDQAARETSGGVQKDVSQMSDE